jgi:hypothetical protein
MILFGGITATAVQLESPPPLRARITSIYTLFLTGAIPLGQLTLGMLGATVGLRQVFLGAGCLVLVAGLFGLVRLRRLYSWPEGTAEGSESAAGDPGDLATDPGGATR